jgi:imidazole glycerol-phosphate synthase subunit HisF
MLRSRVIPCLLIHNNGLVKTVKFKDKIYIGDPINTVKIFNEKQVDELMILDIDATVLGKEPNFKLIEKLANECRMPLCYGGGIKTSAQADKIFSLGVEKIALSSAAVKNPELINEISNMVGSQSVVVVLDIKKNLFGKYEIFTHNATNKFGGDIEATINQLIDRGVGELVINSVDHDGVMKGYDFTLLDRVYAVTSVPLTMLGGAGSLSDITEAVEKYKIVGVAAGSLFVFKGKYKAVLINYPENLFKIGAIQSKGSAQL